MDYCLLRELLKLDIPCCYSSRIVRRPCEEDHLYMYLLYLLVVCSTHLGSIWCGGICSMVLRPLLFFLFWNSPFSLNILPWGIQRNWFGCNSPDSLIINGWSFITTIMTKFDQEKSMFTTQHFFCETYMS